MGDMSPKMSPSENVTAAIKNGLIPLFLFVFGDTPPSSRVCEIEAAAVRRKAW